ncbi:recombinase family protein [Nonomuraea rubra]|uniref:recombinase family protein n=1 Tax=Nonomuraea rubra TaxID=46180 RepID=UPI003403491F
MANPRSSRSRRANKHKRIGLRWGIYARLSQDKRKGTDDEEFNVNNQVRDLTKWIHERDPEAEIVEIYIDNDIPASGRMTKRKLRKRFNQMRADARDGLIDAAAAWHLDRYTRRPRELEDMLDIHDEHGMLWHCKTGDIDLATSTGRAMARMLAAWGAYEGDLKVERMQLTFSNYAEEGRAHTGGMRCYGYTDDDTELIPHEVAVIREMREWVLPPNPRSVRSLCRMLNERGDFTTTGGMWQPTSVVRLLTNPRLRGARTYHDEIVKENAFPRVFTDEEFADLEAYFGDPERHQAEPKRKSLLSGGILICGKCGNNLTSQPSNSKQPGYVCRKTNKGVGCGGLRIQAAPTEADVAAKVLAVYVSPKVRAEVRRRAEEQADAGSAEQLRNLRERLAELGRERARGEMTKEAFAAAENYLTREINKIRASVREAQKLAGLPRDLPMSPAALAEWWTSEETTLEERRAVIMSVVDHVVVGPTLRRGFNGFEPDRLTYVWR